MRHFSIIHAKPARGLNTRMRIFHAALILTTVTACGTPGASANAGPYDPQDEAVLDITSFGARCDGSDDTAAVQAAMNATPINGTLMFSCLAGIRQVELSNRANITFAGLGGGGVALLAQTGDPWSRAFSVIHCESCTIRDMVFEGNSKDIIPFSIEQSTNSTVIGLRIRNVKQAGAAFLAIHNDGNKYLNNIIENVGMDRSPVTDTTRGMWIGNVADTQIETNVTIADNNLADISGTAIAVHGSGIAITGNSGVRLNSSCVKVLPLGGSGETLIADNRCSGAGAKWQIGGGLMTEYWNSSSEKTTIRNNFLEGYSEADVARIPDSANIGINIANSDGKITRNLVITNNTIRNFLYDGIQISSSIDNFVIDSNLVDRTNASGVQWNGITLLGDGGKVMTNGTIRRNLIHGKFDGIRIDANPGTISRLKLDANSLVSMSRDGVHVEVQNGGRISEIGLSDPCFSRIGRQSIWDNRPKSEQLRIPSVRAPLRDAARPAPPCGDPRQR
jgi:hypothetical protein